MLADVRLTLNSIVKESKVRLIVIAVVVFVMTSIATAAEIVDAEFRDSSGKQLYHTTNLMQDLTTWYGVAFANVDAKVLLIETDSLTSAEYQQQDSDLDDLGHDVEENAVLFVIACTKEENHGSYHTTREAAKDLSLGKYSFRIRLLNSRGVVLKNSLKPVSTRDLRLWMKK